jgi:UDP-N-acetylmuramate-alanine ligase
LNLKEIHSVYLIGIGGIGMSALARYFNAQGKSVSGYDKTATSLTDELVVEGIQISLHDNLDTIPSLNMDCTLVVYTPAIPQDSIIFNYFKNNGYDLYKRSEVLGFITESSFAASPRRTGLELDHSSFTLPSALVLNQQKLVEGVPVADNSLLSASDGERLL